jgi:hypothetical protein
MFGNLIIICVAALLPVVGLAESVELRKFPSDSLKQVSPQTGVKLVRMSSIDSDGSLSIRTRQAQTYEILDAGNLDVEEAVLVFRAKMKTYGVKGSVFLETVCELPGLGRMSIQGLQYSLSGTNDWEDVEVKYPLRKGEKADSVKLNLVFDSKGRVWLDDIRLYREDLPDDSIQ